MKGFDKLEGKMLPAVDGLAQGVCFHPTMFVGFLAHIMRGYKYLCVSYAENICHCCKNLLSFPVAQGGLNRKGRRRPNYVFKLCVIDSDPGVLSLRRLPLRYILRIGTFHSIIAGLGMVSVT